MLACCARATSGHAAAPPMSVMNSRRLKEPSLSLKDYVLWPSIQASKQESAPNETGARCDNVRGTNPERSVRMSPGERVNPYRRDATKPDVNSTRGAPGE